MSERKKWTMNAIAGDEYGDDYELWYCDGRQIPSEQVLARLNAAEEEREALEKVYYCGDLCAGCCQTVNAALAAKGGGG